MNKQNQNSKNRNLVPAGLCIIVFSIFTFLALLALIILLAVEEKTIVILATVGVFLIGLVVVLISTFKLVNKTNNKIDNEIQKAEENGVKKARKDYEKPAEVERIQEIINSVRKETGAHKFLIQNYSFDAIPLEYVSKKEGIVKYTSLIKELDKVIDTTKQYMNALVHIHFDVGVSLNEDCIRESLKKIIEYLKYPLRLASYDEEHTGFLVYIPCFDSIHQVEEEIEFLTRELTLVLKRTFERKFVVARSAMVVYPYSKAEDLLKDLRIASKSKKIVNVYLPKIEVNEFIDEDIDLNDGNNLSHITQIIEKTSSLDARVEFREENEEKVRTFIALMRKYYAFDGAGLILFDDVNKEFKCQYSSGEVFFEKNRAVNPIFIDAIDKHKDFNGSYYFSNRDHSNNEIAYFLDYYGINSGQLFPLVVSNKLSGILFFLNKHKELYFDSYLKEKLFVFGSLLTGYISRVACDDDASSSNKKFKEVLRFSSSCLYSIDKNDYTLSYVSDALRPDLRGEIGQKCHKALYGKDTPCKNCPIKSLRHMISELGNHTYDSKVVFKNTRDKYIHMSLTPIEKDGFALDKFDQDYLIPSSKSLLDALNNEYLTQNNGYVSFFMIDNFADLIKNHKEEGYLDIQKKYLESLESAGYSMYYIKANVFAIILPNADLAKTSKVLQSIHHISKESGLDITYLCKEYPKGSKDASEFFKEANKLVTGFEFMEHINEICVPDEKYSRLAAEDDYVINIIEKGIESGELGVEYTPVLNNSDRLIHAVEITLAEKDPHTKDPIDNASALALLDKRGMIGKLTCGYLKVLDKILEKYGYGFFTSNNVENVIIHTEFSFINEENLKVLEDLINRYQVANGFIRFEVYEKDVVAHKDEYKRAVRALNDVGASLSVGHYVGAELAMVEAAQIGAVEVKVDESLTDVVTQTPAALEKVLNLWKEAHLNKVKVAFTGIRSREHSEAFHLDESDSRVQGKYFYPASNIDAFMTAVKLRNGSEDKFNT